MRVACGSLEQYVTKLLCCFKLRERNEFLELRVLVMQGVFPNFKETNVDIILYLEMKVLI